MTSGGGCGCGTPWWAGVKGARSDWSSIQGKLLKLDGSPWQTTFGVIQGPSDAALSAKSLLPGRPGPLSAPDHRLSPTPAL